MSSNSNQLVLVVGNKLDLHIQRVTDQLASFGVMTCILDPSNANASSSIVSRVSKSRDQLWGHDAEGTSFSLEAVTAVWWRLKPTFEVPSSEEARLRSEFCAREWRHVFESLEVWLDRAKWLNPRAVDRKVRYKPTQLLLAQNFGFDIPDTMISNDPESVMDFLATHGNEGIYKPVTWYFTPPDKVLFTNPINTEFISQNALSIKLAPGIFQQRIPKAFELRITVIGKTVFPFRIDSQMQEGAKVDWRRKQLDITYELCRLESSFEEQLLSFHHSLGLVYGAYDFIVTPDRKYVFLEVNPGGQWLWIEDKTGCPISTSVAKALLQE